MKTIEFYENYCGCGSGVCSPKGAASATRMSILKTLTNEGYAIFHFNPVQHPDKFVNNEIVNNLMQKNKDVLPITIVNEKLFKTNEMPTDQELKSLIGG